MKASKGIARMTMALAILVTLPALGHAHSLSEQKATAQGAIDQRSMAAPARNTIYSCEFTAMGPALNRPWVTSDGLIYFAEKPVVPGSVAWKDGGLKVSASRSSRKLSGQGVPDHKTGTYPMPRDSEAYSFDRNPNGISEYKLSYVLPLKPKMAAKPSCLPMGTIGVALTGGVFFNALDADRRDAVANEVFDACEAHPQARGVYHYHHASPCFPQGEANEHSPLAGYALDGFGIYGLRGEGGKALSNADLDECHGHMGPVPGGTAPVYHYHLTEAFPYTLGCFKGEIDLSKLRRAARMGPPGMGPPGMGPRGGRRPGPPPGRRGPPPPR